MRFSGIIENDFSAAPGISTTFFVQGCPFHCPGCHNQHTWDFDGGKEFTPKVLENIITALTANGLKRNLCIMGGEPLCEQNIPLTHLVISKVKEKLPDTPVYIWTGYIYENLLKNPAPHLQNILSMTDVLIDGPYIDTLRDVTLSMRGSSNQRIINLTNK
jgi:anaerobic ribonucleoside-triphosphate reductase activating protein